MSVPRDYFAKDNSLVYKRTAGDFLLYRRGLDFDDDAGTPSRWRQREKGGDRVVWPVTGAG